VRLWSTFDLFRQPEIYFGDRARGPVRANERAGFRDHIAVNALRALLWIKIDGRNARNGERDQLPWVRDPVAVAILPDREVRKSRVAGIDPAVAIRVQLCKIGESIAAGCAK